MTVNFRFLAVGAWLLAATSVAQPAEVKDHPLVSRFAGSTVVESSITEFDEFYLPLGRYQNPPKKFANLQRLEGRITHFHYTNPPNHSTLEILRSYQNPLQQAGFQPLYACNSPKECSDYADPHDFEKWIGRWCNDTPGCPPDHRYLAGKLSRSSGDVYVVLNILAAGFPSEVGTFLNVIEVKPMQGGSVTVNSAAKLASDITQTGHAAVYGIYFDSGKAALKPESEATLVEIVKLLSSNAQLKLVVVGHTDNAGGIAPNMTLSKQRADAVVAALTSRYHIAPERLQGVGVGPVAPVESNHTDDGRAKNRRVELVEL